jgi:hypothetical protein
MGNSWLSPLELVVQPADALPARIIRAAIDRKKSRLLVMFRASTDFAQV